MSLRRRKKKGKNYMRTIISIQPIIKWEKIKQSNRKKRIK